MPGEPITTIENKHVEECGEPPQFDQDDYSYISYFENEHGEQALFLFDDDENQAEVYIADADWETPQIIPARELDGMTPEKFTAISRNLMAQEEKLWFKACLEAIQFRL